MKVQAILAAACFVGVLCTPVLAQSNDSTQTTTTTSPGKGKMTRTRTVVATVTQVDASKRAVTLKGPQGTSYPLVVGPDVRNLEQVKVGDRVTVRYQESLSLELKKNGKELRSSAVTADAVRSPAGARPAGAIGEQVEVTADVVAVDTKNQIVTLRGPVETVELWVRDRAQLKLIKVGDQVQAVYTQAVALSVDPAPGAK